MAAVQSEQASTDQLNTSLAKEENDSLNSESETEDIIERLHDVTALTIPDRDIPSSLEDSDSIPSTEPGETGSVGATSNTQSDCDSVSQTESKADENGEDDTEFPNGHTSDDSKNSSVSESSSDKKQTDNNQNETITKTPARKKSLNPVKGFLKKFTKSSSKSESKSKQSTKKSVTSEELAAITIDKLPQCFIVKYLGKRECTGLWGIKHVRKPVDEMVSEVTKKLETDGKPVELPLMYLVVSPKGLELREHPNNRVKGDSVPDKSSHPIDFISYGVQDLKFWRVFTFIIVQELSARSKKMECHAFICDSSVAARKVAVSLALAFKVNIRRLKQEGKEHRFQVDLRSPDELADKFAASKEEQVETEGAEC